MFILINYIITETAAVDRLLPPPTENISVSVCLWTLENELVVLWCILSLLVGGTIEMH